jgi:stearoyl-CoA desaturase (delta-9 desaturase)
MLWIPFWAAGVINGLGHWWGYRNFESPDGSTNISPVGIIIGGEELHNNHHAFPSSAKFSARWWEFDIGWLYIRVLSALRLAKVKRVAPCPMFDPNKERMDLETVKAVIRSRMYVMRNYGTSVIMPVLKEELHKADESCRAMLKRAKRLLIKEETRMDANSKSKLDKVLRLSSQLNTVYEFRRKLQEIWNIAGASQEKLLSALQEWCVQAEESGIQSLKEFAEKLRGYGLKSA